MSIPFFFSGSRSDDFDQPESVTNPLPPCPDSPNCVRITQILDESATEIRKAVRHVLEQMKPGKIETGKKQNRIETVFQILFFKDDMVIKIEEKEASTLLHIRSSSRKGYSDLGVNRRRVKRFLKLLRKNLTQPV